MTVYTLKIDGRDVAGSEGQSIMDVAEENGIDIPGLCHLPGIHDRGACRLCVVKIGGSPRLAAACVTKIAEGMDVVAHDEELEEYRRAATDGCLSIRRQCHHVRHCHQGSCRFTDAVQRADRPARR